MFRVRDEKFRITTDGTKLTLTTGGQQYQHTYLFYATFYVVNF
jgi:hypothetical protein